VAATGSDAGRGRRHLRSALRRRVTLRLRLTLLYGACFLVGAAAVLAVTYGLVAHDTSGQARRLHVHGAQIHLPAVPLTVVEGRSGGASTSSPNRNTLTIARIQISPNGTEIFTWTPSQSTTGSAAPRTAMQEPRLSGAQLAKLKAGALAYAKCVRAHGVPGFPDPTVETGPDGRGAGISPPYGSGARARAAARSPALRAAIRTCSPLVTRDMPGTPDSGPNFKRIASSLQEQVNVIVDRANGALTTQRRRSLGSLLTWSGAALAVMALISILLGWLLAGRALAPLRTMTSRARRITEENLHERLSVDTQEDEIGELANTFDGVLARLQRAFAAQKRFVANASHELRTPVTLERALLEVVLSDPDADAKELRHACERVLASTEQQERIIEALLALARSQGGTAVDTPVNLADLAQDAITLREQRLDGLTLATDLHPAPLTGDQALLERLIANLIDNAITHNRAEDAWITVETGNEGMGSWLRVSNSGPEVPEGMLSEIFEPFRRMDGERTATAGGLGLGLSIVQAIAEVHGAAVGVRPVDGGGLQVDVRFRAA
jgi:signal transduction histidine kinase